MEILEEDVGNGMALTRMARAWSLLFSLLAEFSFELVWSMIWRKKP